jgi:hypothetical protein
MASLATGVGQWPSETGEILNVLIFPLTLLLLFKQHYVWMAVVLAVGTLNRESTWLLLPPILVQTYVNSGRKGTAFACLAAVAIPYAGVRWLVVSPRPDWWRLDGLGENIPFVSMDLTPGAVMANIKLLLLLGPFILLGASRFREHHPELRLAALVVPPFLIVHYLFGKITELRLWVPLLTILIPLAIGGWQRVRRE